MANIILGKCQVIMLAEYRDSVLLENELLILFATVGTFNQKDKEAGNRQIYQCKLDKQNQSAWDSLKNPVNDHFLLFMMKAITYPTSKLIYYWKGKWVKNNYRQEIKEIWLFF